MASNINWSRAPLRRKDFKRRSSKPRASKHPQLKQAITYIIVSALTLLYYTSPNRSSLLVIFMDSLICKQVLQSMIHAGRRCRQKLHQSGSSRPSTPPLYRPPFILASFQLLGSSLGYRIWMQVSLNKMMHSYNGNPDCPTLIELEPLLFPESTSSIEVVGQGPQTVDVQQFHSSITLSKHFLLSCRSPSPQNHIGIQMVQSQRLHRTGRRKTFIDPQGTKIVYSKRSPRQANSRFQNSLTAQKPTPPHRGTPGTTQVVDEECKPFDPY